MSSKGRQRQHLESGVLDKLMGVRQIQKLGAVCLTGCSSVALIFFFFFPNVKIDMSAQKCARSHICSEAGK